MYTYTFAFNMSHHALTTLKRRISFFFFFSRQSAFSLL